MISVEEAYALIDQHVRPLAGSESSDAVSEEVALAAAVGRVLANPVFADLHSPPHRKSVMDGFAVRSADINGGVKELNVVESIIAGGTPTKSVGAGEAARIMTGAPMPEGADAVVMVELTTLDESAMKVTIDLEQIAAGHHCMDRGENFEQGQAVFPGGHLIRGLDVGLLAEVGAATCCVLRKPTVAVLPTGNELVACDQFPSEGQIRNSNGPMLAAMLRQIGIEARELGIGADDESQLKQLISAGLQHDLLILSGGVSAGTMDLVPGILQSLGVRQVFHKVKVKPGKPIYFGVLDRDDRRTYVFGLPGNPVSSLVGFRLFVANALAIMSGCDSFYPPALTGVLTKDHQARGNRPTYWPGRQNSNGGSGNGSMIGLEPQRWNGSSDLLSLATTTGLIEFPAGTELHPAGSKPYRFLPF